MNKKAIINLTVGLLLSITFTTAAVAEETLMGHITSFEGVTFQVFSGGCTTKDSFEVLQRESFPVQVQLVRNTPDYCEAHVPFGTLIAYTWEELGMPANQYDIIVNEDVIENF